MQLMSQRISAKVKKKRDFFFAFSHSVNADEIDDYRKRFQVIGKAQ